MVEENSSSNSVNFNNSFRHEGLTLLFGKLVGW